MHYLSYITSKHIFYSVNIGNHYPKVMHIIYNVPVFYGSHRMRRIWCSLVICLVFNSFIAYYCGLMCIYMSNQSFAPCVNCTQITQWWLDTDLRSSGYWRQYSDHQDTDVNTQTIRILTSICRSSGYWRQYAYYSANGEYCEWCRSVSRNTIKRDKFKLTHSMFGSGYNIDYTKTKKKVYLRGIIRVNRCCEPYFSQGTIPGQTVKMNSTSSSQETLLAIFTYTNNKRVMFIKYIRVC